MRILSLIIAAVLVAYVMRQDDRDDAADSDDAPELGKAAGTDGASACEDAADGDANDDAVRAGDGTDAADDSDACWRASPLSTVYHRNSEVKDMTALPRNTNNCKSYY